VRNFGLSFGLMLCWLVGLWFALPDFALYHIQTISPADTFVFGGGQGEWPISVASNTDGRQRAQTKPTHGVYRQASFTLPNKDGITLIAPRLQTDSGLWVNNIPLGSDGLVPSAGPALGPLRNQAVVGPIFLDFSPNRVDLLAPEGFGWQGMGPIWYGDLNQGSPFLKALDAYQKRLVDISLWIGLWGGLACVIGLFFRGNRVVFALGLATAMMLCGQGLGILPNIILWVLIACSAGACWVMAIKKGVLFASLIGCAAVGTLSGLIICAFAPAPSLYLKFAGLSVVSIWPMIGMGLPIMTGTALRGLVGDFITARTKIANQEIIIQTKEAELHAAIRSGAINEERQRFVRDMHDGVGGQLLSLLMQMRSKTIAPDAVEEELQRSLHDLRLMADSLDHVGSDLDLALTAFERRAAQQLASAGIGLVWSKSPDLNLLAWDGRKILNLYRVLQEAMTNCIRHAGATKLMFSFELDSSGNGLNVTISDDGIGIDPKAPKGRGLTNIVKRAKALGAETHVTNGGDGRGTQIELRTAP
jgi:signal transduction histidine kinase